MGPFDKSIPDPVDKDQIEIHPNPFSNNYIHNLDDENSESFSNDDFNSNELFGEFYLEIAEWESI